MIEFYFDCAAAAPPFPEALNAQAEAARRWYGNPSASHEPGRAARDELERLRARFSAMCGFTGGRLVLMSGATEANNWAVHGVMTANSDSCVLAAEDVHPSVWNACRRYGHRMESLPLDRQGRIRLSALAAAIKPNTRLVCCSHAANETGVIHDVGAIAAACERRNIPCLVDGVQALGHIPVDLSVTACDFYVFAAHKFGGPRGCGGIFLRSAAATPLLDGGTQEWGLRPGTENLAAFAGTVTALEMSLTVLPVETERLRALSRIVVEKLRRSGLSFVVNGNPEEGLPGLLSLSFAGLDAHALVTDLAVQGFAVASGSACSADRPEPSRAILALGHPPETALGTIRTSFGRFSRPEGVQTFADALVRTVKRMRDTE